MKKIILIMTAIILLISVAGCGSRDSEIQSQNSKTVKIAYLPLTHAMPLFVEKELQKDNKEMNIELVKFGSWPELLDALNTGQVDGASVLIELAMKSKEQGLGLKAVALGHTDGNVIVASKKIKAAKDLKGKTIAIPHRQSSHFLLVSQTLERVGLSLDDVKIVELPPPEMPSALASGQIDSYCVAEPFGAKAIALGAGHVLYESGDLWNHSLCCGLVLTDDFITERKDTANEFVSAYKDAGKYIGKNQKKVYEMTKQYLNIDKKVYDISMRWIRYDDLSITEDSYRDLTQRMKALKLSQTPPEYSDFVNTTLY